MEHQTRFDLERAMADWRMDLAAKPGLTPEDVRELEAHLLECVAELRQRELNEEEAFWLARHRLGSPEQLGEEFAKANPARVWRERVFWMVLAFLAIDSARSISSGAFGIYLKVTTAAPDSSWLTSSWLEGIFIASALLATTIIPIAILVMTARGRFHGLAIQIAGILRTRWRVALAGVLALLLCRVSDFAIYYALRHQNVPGWADISFARFSVMQASRCFLPLCWVALVTWLAPSNMRTPATALAKG